MKAQNWLYLSHCKNVKEGDKVRHALDPEKEPYEDLSVIKVYEDKIIFTNGHIVLEHQFKNEHYWYQNI